MCVELAFPSCAPLLHTKHSLRSRTFSFLIISLREFIVLPYVHVLGYRQFALYFYASLCNNIFLLLTKNWSFIHYCSLVFVHHSSVQVPISRRIWSANICLSLVYYFVNLIQYIHKCHKFTIFLVLISTTYLLILYVRSYPTSISASRSLRLWCLSEIEEDLSINHGKISRRRNTGGGRSKQRSSGRRGRALAAPEGLNDLNQSWCGVWCGWTSCVKVIQLILPPRGRGMDIQVDR